MRKPKFHASGHYTDLVALKQWCNRNAIFVNVKKTKYMLFGSRVALAKYRDKENLLKIDKQAISRVHSYLRVTLDEELNTNCPNSEQ